MCAHVYLIVLCIVLPDMPEGWSQVKPLRFTALHLCFASGLMLKAHHTNCCFIEMNEVAAFIHKELLSART